MAAMFLFWAFHCIS